MEFRISFIPIDPKWNSHLNISPNLSRTDFKQFGLDIIWDRLRRLNVLPGLAIFVKEGKAAAFYPIFPGDYLQKALITCGYKSREMGASDFLFFSEGIFRQGLAPLGFIPRDDFDRCVICLQFSIDLEPKQSKFSFIPFKKPGKVLTVGEETYNSDSEDITIEAFWHGYND